MNGARAFPALAATTTPVGSLPPLVSLLDPQHPLAFLRNSDGMIGLGEALRLEFSGPTRVTDAADAWRRITDLASVDDTVLLPGSGLVAFGSFAFDDFSRSVSLLVVPSVVLGRRDGVCWMTRVHAAAVADGSAPELPRAAAPGSVVSGDFVAGAMSERGYVDAVASAVASIDSGAVRKVVIARDASMTIPDNSDLRQSIGALATAYPDTFTFAVDGLLGSSPETLVRAWKGEVSARVLAGSAARGADADQDAAAATGLAASAKDIAEHAFALSSVLRSLGPRSRTLTASPAPFALRLPNIWHLASDVTGTLADDASALDLVAAAHPTAAVAGDPTDAALALIRELEPFDRGRYAGPVGWVDARGDGEWAIALRCAQVSPRGVGDTRTVTAYAGAGIVAGSDPEGELAETALKLRPVIDAFR